eukprot:gnl/TRDRNA2_/TRDRNA2_31637_c0_seq1.p1 gnl/TRDRNA2_/TRDRNA2_31637_c0~~gnl/TRDRNA2_/TRDRNA2_31637_c0_seq1.p1  ORF type:complete len:213 (+),score=41.80 gnl/TRDRNA2_/TRDRNA2_31637_c0_seq1:58-696(+)
MAPRERRQHARELQICLNVVDRPRGFVRSVTAARESDVAELRQRLRDLKTRAVLLTYDAAIQELEELRDTFVGRRGSVSLSAGANPLSVGLSASDAIVRSSEGRSAAKLPKTVKKSTSKERRRLAGAERAKVLKGERRGLFAPRRLSPELAAIVGRQQCSYTEILKGVWGYIKANGLQSRRTVTPDQRLRRVLPAASVDWLQVAKMLRRHVL